ncbi:helix-turn-helix domain-containing protein [Halorhodospira halochloris]|uniref:helix-turn-helix domain-containing protein n=1 Tax=Halorhodospira halochloris TaxID=1052 RepID=UPI001EE87781|nr:helix-turn-helix domain-containing protein [Halorhodospira halochloris]MCG5549170.1 hypothetical protein [Halorhodospira halochloris]
MAERNALECNLAAYTKPVTVTGWRYATIHERPTEKGKAMGTSNTAAARLKSAERKARALELRQTGMTYADIGRELGISNAQAHRLVSGALQEIRKRASEEAEQLRTLELSRLDQLHHALWESALGGELRAIDRLLRIMERRAKLLGLDAPTCVAPTNPDGQKSWQPTDSISDEERVRRIAEILQAVKVQPTGEAYE